MALCTLWLFLNRESSGEEFWRDLCHYKVCNNEISICIMYKKVESACFRHIIFPTNFVKPVLINQVDKLQICLAGCV